MTDSAALDRERRLLAALAQPRADACAAEDALLVSDRGVRHWHDAPPCAEVPGPPAEVPDPQIDGLSTLTVTEHTILVTYRLLAPDGTAPQTCSTVWQRGPSGWVAVLHQRSPGEPVATGSA